MSAPDRAEYRVHRGALTNPPLAAVGLACAFGLLCLGLPILALGDREEKRVGIGIIVVVCVLAVMAYLSARSADRAYRVFIDADGFSLRGAKATTTLRWADVTRAGAESLPSGLVLVVTMKPGNKAPGFPPWRSTQPAPSGGLAVFVLSHVDCPPADLIEVLATFAGPVWHSRQE